MPGITGQGTTFNLPNFVGELFEITPMETPFLSAIGGLTGGRRADASIFTWQTVDMRDADATRQRLEGAAAPTAEARVRANVSNVLEIHQEAIDISYSKLSYSGQYASTGSGHPNAVGINGTNPVVDERAFQTQIALKQIARDCELAFITGVKQEPSTNASVRKTDGILNVMTSNVVNAGNAPLTEDMVLDLMQEIWTSGGITDQETVAVMCGGSQMRKLSDIFFRNGNRFYEQSRTVAGVQMATILTEFGTLNVMLNRFMPVDTIAVVSMDECAPRFAEVPGKGFLFVEPLAKTGASERDQIYGEIGLEYGVERHHGKITDLNTTGS
jgi:hypothetical protein